MSKGDVQEAPAEPISIVKLLYNQISNNQLSYVSKGYMVTFRVYITVTSSKLIENNQTKCIQSVIQYLN